MPSDKIKGIVRLLGSGVFLLFALIKLSGQPLGELLYTSRATVTLYLLISLSLASSSAYLFVKRKIMVRNYHK